MTSRFLKDEKIKRVKERHEQIIEHGCTVDDLFALIESGKRFGVIYADPPWPFETSQTRRSVEHHYNTSTLDEIMKLPVAQLAADDCALVMWCTWPHIAIGTHCKIIEAWNFKPSTVAFVWVKQKPGGNGLRHSGNGYWTIANTEACLIATKGSPLRLANDVHQVVMAPVREHSGKPEEVRQRIERLFPGPYLELYARKPAPGWTCWGNEIPHGEFRESLVTSCDHRRTEDSGTHVAPVPGDDLSIPEFLRRLPPEAAQ
jgi:site-specific DNA-methyltransferase (adenine-specific)